MAVTFTFSADASGRQRVGRQTVVTGRITLTGTYDTGGFAITPAAFGLGTIDSLTLGMAWLTTTALGTEYDPANAKILLTETAGTVDLPFKELTNATSTTGYVMDITAKGK